MRRACRRGLVFVFVFCSLGFGSRMRVLRNLGIFGSRGLVGIRVRLVCGSLGRSHFCQFWLWRIRRRVGVVRMFLRFWVGLRISILAVRSLLGVGLC